jgi:hypothetical protein
LLKNVAAEETVASRVAASHLATLGCPEMVAHARQEHVGTYKTIVIVSFILKHITLAFLLLSGQHWLLLLSKLQNLCTDISQQFNFSLFLILIIITIIGFTICCCSVIQFFCTTITASLLSQPHLIALSQPCF